jgi:choice-of-anchor A domain-containing protein
MKACVPSTGPHWALRAPLLFLLAAVGPALHAQTTQAQQQTDVTNLESDFQEYNLISLSNVSLTSYGDTEGGIAVNGALTLDAGQIASQNSGIAGNPTLYATGTLTLGGEVQIEAGGFATVPGASGQSNSWNSSNKTLTVGGGSINSQGSSTTQSANNPINNPTPSGWSWTTLASNSNAKGLGTISTSLKNATATGTVSVSGGNLILTGPVGQTTGVVVFDLNAANISGNDYNGQNVSDIQINVPTGMTYVIDVLNAGGHSLFASGTNFNPGSNPGGLLWNFEGSGTVTLDAGGTFSGAILDTSGAVDATQLVQGEIAVDGFTDCGYELHDQDFTPAVVATPEPSTYALWAVGLCACGIAVRRFRRVAVA